MVKKIISGQTYDTDTATRVHHFTYHDHECYQGLYQTRHGAFFLWEHDSESGDVKALTDDEAFKWLEKHAIHLVEQYFHPFPEGGAPERWLAVRRRNVGSRKSKASEQITPRTVRNLPYWLRYREPVFVGGVDIRGLFGDDDPTPVPDIVCHIMEEVYIALHNNARRLVAMGVRAALDHMITDKVDDYGNFARNVDEFEKAGYLSRQQRMDLDTILEAGHSATHRGWEPTDDQINALLDNTESLIESVYLDRARAARLAREVPKRPPKLKKP